LKNLKITAAIQHKLKTKHLVDVAEVRQCFLNKNGKLLTDNRALTKTNPPTLWFIARTNKNRLLKIVYIQKDMQIILKTDTPTSRMRLNWRFMRAMAWRADAEEGETT
jgi:hypothetical protein